MIFFKACLIVGVFAVHAVASSSEEEDARRLYAQSFYGAVAASPFLTPLNALTPYSSFESDEEDTHNEERWRAMLAEKERSIRELLSLVQQQQTQLAQQSTNLQTLRGELRNKDVQLAAKECAINQEKNARHQKETALQDLQARYRGYDRYQITLNRTLKYVKPQEFTSFPWALTPEQRHAIANLVTPEAGGLLTIKKI